VKPGQPGPRQASPSFYTGRPDGWGVVRADLWGCGGAVFGTRHLMRRIGLRIIAPYGVWGECAFGAFIGSAAAL